LLLHRTREPNRGRWSPPGGKLKTWLGESPYRCACREAGEEMNLALSESDLRLTGLVSEAAYQGTTHWLMFLFEIRRKLEKPPPPHEEGVFAFYSRTALDRLDLPDTDRDFLWPQFWKHRGGFFAAHGIWSSASEVSWHLEESIHGTSHRPQQ